MANLTEKQEKFCLAFLETGNASAAYRSSYNASRMKDTTVNKRASELLTNGDIAGRLDELRRPALQRAELTLQGHLAELADLRDAAKEKGLISAAVAAEVARGKAAGFYRNAEATGTAVQVNIDNRRAQDLTDDELMAICRQNDLHVLPSAEFEQEIKTLFHEI